MRALPATVVLASIVLGGWLTGANAQVTNPEAPPALNSASGDQSAANENLPPGVIPQPTPAKPGMVAGVTLGELYTDNLRLAGGDNPKQSSWITQVQPFFKGATSSPRFSGLVDYSLTGYLYLGQAHHSQAVQDLNAEGQLTILPQHFFIDGSARYGNEVINNQLPAGSGTFFLDSNRANVAMASLSPYWVQDLGNVGTMTVRYTRGRVVYNDRGIPGENHDLLEGIPDVTSNAGQFSLVSPKYQTWGWNLGYSEQRLDPDFGQGIEFALARLGGSMQVNNDLRLLADVGKESNFLPDGTEQKLGARFWDAGFEWSNSHDNFKLLAGHRFFGRSYQLSWTHHAALLTTNVSYEEQPTDYNQQLTGTNFGSGALPPINVGPEIPSLQERQPYLSKRLSASVVYTMPHSRLNLTVYDERRTYFYEDDEHERVENASIAWLFNLGAFTTFTPRFTWQRYRFRDGQVNDTRYAELALVHQLNPRNFGSVRLRRDVRGVESAAPDVYGYNVNVIFVQWTHLF